jgi:hypothetical protein
MASDKVSDRGMLERARVGWEYLELERRRNALDIVTKDALAAFDSSSAYSQPLPARNG